MPVSEDHVKKNCGPLLLNLVKSPQLTVEEDQHFRSTSGLLTLANPERDLQQAYEVYCKVVQQLKYTSPMIAEIRGFGSQNLLIALPPAPLWNNLTCLRKLDLCIIEADDFSPICGIKTLEWLNLSSTKITNSAPLGKLTRLKFLNLYNAQNVTDASFLVGLTELEELKLSCTQVSKLPPLLNHKKLRKLEISFSPIQDLSALADLEALEDFHHACVRISDLTAIRNLVKLMELSFFACLTSRADMGDLANLRLVGLSLLGARIDDISRLGNAKTLEWLSLESTLLTDIKPLARYKNLKNITLDYSEVSDLSPLKDLQKLELIRMRRCENLFKALPNEDEHVAAQRIIGNKVIVEQFKARGVKVVN